MRNWTDSPSTSPERSKYPTPFRYTTTFRIGRPSTRKSGPRAQPVLRLASAHSASGARHAAHWLTAVESAGTGTRSYFGVRMVFRIFLYTPLCDGPISEVAETAELAETCVNGEC